VGDVSKGTEMEIPHPWISSALAGLERVNPFIDKLENLNVYDDDDDIVLHFEQKDSTSSEIAAVISLAPTSQPSQRKIVIQRKGNVKPIFLDVLSPFVEPLHYLLLLPEGTMGWSPDRRTPMGRNLARCDGTGHDSL
jgi:hypothetical protein